MLTIIRVTTQRKEDLGPLEAIGTEMNRIKPGVFTGMRRRGDGFTCEISTSPNFVDHERAALGFVQQFASHLGQARSVGATVTMDMALDFADFKKPIEGVHFGPELLRALGGEQVSLEVTVYTGLDFGSAGTTLP
jgi:hypothetical protein